MLAGQFGHQGGVRFQAEVSQCGVVGQEDLVGAVGDGVFRQSFHALAEETRDHLPAQRPAQSAGGAQRFPRRACYLPVELLNPDENVVAHRSSLKRRAFCHWSFGHWSFGHWSFGHSSLVI
jgi:hypothetical protein